MSKRRLPKLFPEDVTEEQILEAAGALGSLTVQPGWAVWESLVHESREDALESLVASEPAKVGYWQGYAAALGAVLSAPGYLLDSAKTIQDEQVERGEPINDRVRVGYDSSDPSV